MTDAISQGRPPQHPARPRIGGLAIFRSLEVDTRLLGMIVDARRHLDRLPDR